MMRKLILATAAVTALTLGSAVAQTYELDISAQLRAQGYQNITLSHTWLGRTRIVATLGGDLREIVFDPNTGEILRDLSRTVMADSGHDTGTSPRPAPSAGVVASAGASAGNGTATAMPGVAAMTTLDSLATDPAMLGVTAAPNAGSAVGTRSGTGANGGTIGQPAIPFVILNPAGGM
jgi:hypothetical protein